jgi:hypothetical protein
MFVLKHPQEQPFEISFDYAMPQGRGYVLLEDAAGSVLGTYRMEQTAAENTAVNTINLKIPPRKSGECMMQIVFEKPLASILLPVRRTQPIKMVCMLPNMPVPLVRGTSLYLQTTGNPSFKIVARPSVPASFALHDVCGGRLGYAMIWAGDNISSDVLTANAPLPAGIIINFIAGLSIKNASIKSMSGVAPYAAARADEFFIPENINTFKPTVFDAATYSSALSISNNNIKEGKIKKTKKVVAPAAEMLEEMRL